VEQKPFALVVKKRAPAKNTNGFFFFRINNNEVIIMNTANVAGLQIGGPELTIISGPYAIETESQYLASARQVKTAGADAFHAGIRLNLPPNEKGFYGLGKEALRMLRDSPPGLPVASEIHQAQDVGAYYDSGVRLFIIGPQNTGNYILVGDIAKELAGEDAAMMINRPYDGNKSRLENAISTAVKSGMENIIVTLRGYRTGKEYGADLDDISKMEENYGLPVIFNASCASGDHCHLVERVVESTLGQNPSGLLIGSHPEPQNAIYEGKRCIDSSNGKLSDLIMKCKAYH